MFFIFALLDEFFFGRGGGRVKVGDMCIALFFKSEG